MECFGLRHSYRKRVLYNVIHERLVRMTSDYITWVLRQQGSSPHLQVPRHNSFHMLEAQFYNKSYNSYLVTISIFIAHSLKLPLHTMQ